MGLLDWLKRGDRPEGALKPVMPVVETQNISPIWLPAPYTDRSSGYRVQPCVGWSEKGYHPGLTVAPPGEEGVTSWGEPFGEQRHALAASYSAFSGWIESHEAQRDERDRSDRAGRERKKDAAAWER